MLRSISLDISKIAMDRFWNDYIKPKYGEKVKLCYKDTDTFIACMEIEDIYVHIAKDVATRFDTSNYKLDRPLHTAKNKKVIGLIKDE